MKSDDILQFWFEEIASKQWWVKDSQFDQLIISRFGDIHHAASQGELYQWRSTPQGRLAEIIILDQFSRNMFRDTAKAFAFDALALVLAQEAVALNADMQLPEAQRNFIYMPFMHSESLLIHDVAVNLFSTRGSQSSLAFEHKHRDIIVKFGRYPHRNAVLKRQSTAEEIAFLQLPGSSF